MSNDNNRLLLEMEQMIREINRAEINPCIPKLKLSDIDPLLRLVARARSHYLRALFEVAEKTKEGLPSPEQLKHLRVLRLTYEELLQGAHAIDTAIERDYLDVQLD
jgi:hypothetical protein